MAFSKGDEEKFAAGVQARPVDVPPAAEERVAQRSLRSDGPPASQPSFAPDRPPSRWSLGRVGPLILLAWLAVDTGLRFVPADWLQLRPVLVAVRFPRPHGPFEPNLRLYTETFIGEAALEGNVPTRESRPPVHFGTDGLGFRLNPSLRTGISPDLLVWRGASFGYGAALSDDETFAAQLTQVTGRATYNGSRFHLDPDGFPELDWLLTKLPSKPATAVYLALEQNDLADLRGRPVRKLLGVEVRDPRESLEFRYLSRMISTWQRMSPLHILTSRAFKSVSNGVFLPNPYENALRPMRLPDGSHMLMRQYEVESARQRYRREALQKIGEDFLWVQDRLQRREMNLLVVIIPTRLTAYAPWLEGSHESGKEAPAREYLDGLERELASRQIPVVNGLTVLRQTMASDLSEGKLMYYRDDNHWNPDGVRKVAEAVAVALSQMESHRSQVGQAPHVTGRSGQIP